MNAVKRCLALIAATVAVGACSGDPTADLAGANPTILATPGAVWMTQDKTTTVLVQSIDATGAPIPGAWTATTVGPLTATKDPNFQVSSTGGVNNSQQWIIAATAEGEGIVIFTGTGGTDTVRVRVAPAATAFHATISNLNPAIAETLTVTAPAGTRFTATTTVNFVAGAAATVNNGLASPGLLSMSTDSTSLKLLPAPNAAGHLSITGIASIETPSLTSTASTVDSVHVATLLNVPALFSANPINDNVPVTITLPAGTKFRPTSQASFAGGNQFNAFVLSRAADSTAITVVPVPGFDKAVTLTALRDARVASLSLTLPTATNLHASTAVTAANHIIKIGGADPIVGAAIPDVQGPAATGQVVVFFDSLSHDGNDYVGDCGPVGTCFGEHLRIHANYTGNVQIVTDWSGGTATTTDLDVILVADDGAYDTPVHDINGKSFAAATGSKPEGSTWPLVNGTTYVLSVIDFGPLDGGAFGAVKANNLLQVVLTGK